MISNKGVMRCLLPANLNGCLKGNAYSDEKGEQPPGREEGQDGECCVEKRNTQKVMVEHRMKRSTKSRLRSADGDCGAPIQVEDRRKGGGWVRSAELNI